MIKQRTEQSIAIAVLLALVGAMYFGGCAGWQQIATGTLKTSYVAAQGTEAAALKLYEGRCKAAAETCAANKDRECAALVTCQAERRSVVSLVIKVYAGIAAGYSAIAIGDEGLADMSIKKVLILLSELHLLAKKVGLL